MLAAALIVFRESLEAVLVVGLVLGYLARTNQGRLRPMVWIGVAAGVAASAAGAVLFQRIAGSFEGRAEQIFEAVTMLVGAGLILTLVVWVGKRGGAAAALEAKMADRDRRAAQRGADAGWGLLLLVAVSILREGIETVLFLAAAGRDGTVVGAAAGLAGAAAVAAVLVLSSRRISLAGFFAVTNVLLILFAAGLVSRAMHELIEAGVLPPLIERVWSLGPAVRADGAYPAFHQDGAVGGILRGLFGYAAAPSLLEILGWAACAAAAAGTWAAAARPRDGDQGGDRGGGRR
jgi:high-affinity iron transporter